MFPAIAKHNVVPRRFVFVFSTLSSFLLALGINAWAAQPDRIVGTIDSSQAVVLKGNVSPRAQPKYDKGPVRPSMRLPFITLLIQPSADQQAALQELLAEQQDPSSPNYHKWLTPEQFGRRFGLNSADIAKITHWLRSQGFSIVQVARGRDWIAFSGTVAQVQRTFHTEFHRYKVDGEEHFANATDLSIPKALEGVVAGFRGLNDFRLEPQAIKKSDSIKLNPDYFNGGNNLAPGDIATIYDIGPLYTAGIDGTGMKLAVMGQTDIYAVDIAQFRAGFGLSANVPQQILVPGCVDPGVTVDLGEADIDLEWSGAVARNSTIFFVKCDAGHGGVATSAQYAIDNNLAPVISLSYGGCEAANGQSNALAFQQEVQKGNTFGITFLASSGDSGAAQCDSSGATKAMQGLAVNLPASIPEVTAVGGTEFNEGSGTYWSTINGLNGGSALSYIPELAWDDNSTGTGFDTRLSATGGGTSIYFPKPSWQTGPGVPNNNVRNVPDVSMSASADHDGYIVCTNNGGCAAGVQNGSIFGGTSVSTPVFAGIVTLLNQQLKNTPPGVGNINTILYQLAQRVPTAFHDVPAGNYNNGGAANPSGNMVPCQQGTPSCPTKVPFQFGFLTGAGYDQVTGLGSVDAYNLVTGWTAGVTPTTTTAVVFPSSPVNFGTSVTFTATVSPAPAVTNPPQVVVFTDSTFHMNTQIGTGTLNGAGKATFTTGTLARGSHSVVATFSGDSNYGGSHSGPALLNVQDFTIAANPTTVTISSPGQTGTSTITVTPLYGFNQTVTFSCPSGLPSEATCSFNPASVTPNGTTAATTTLTVQTTAPSARLLRPFGRGRLYYALLAPGLLGLGIASGTRRRTWRGMRLLSLIAILAFSTLWMPACGGGNSGGNTNPGTPVGTNPNVVVSATTGGATPLANPVTITVTVN
jgi:subtilase family serine protease